MTRFPNSLIGGRHVIKACDRHGECPFEGNMGACCDGNGEKIYNENLD